MSVVAAGTGPAPIPAGRRCTRCLRDKPAAEFHAAQHVRKDGTRGLVARCKDCVRRSRARVRERSRAPGAKRRTPRTNAAGRVSCAACETYLPSTAFKRHPTRPGAWWWMCRDCTRAYDRERYRVRHLDPARRTAEIGRRCELQRAQARRERAERTRFVADAIGLVRRRGFTKAEVRKLAGVSFGNLLKWERGAVTPLPAVAARFGAVLLATSGYATGTEPAWRRRRPHPDLPALLDRLAPELARHPVRNRWHGKVVA